MDNQSALSSANRENFYKAALLKSKRKVLSDKKQEEQEINETIEALEEAERLKSLKNKRFNLKAKIGNTYNTWKKKTDLSRDNLAYRFQDDRKYISDGGAAASVGAAVGRNPYRSPGKFYKPADLKGIKKIKDDLRRMEGPFLRMVGEDQPDELAAIGEDQLARLAGMNDYLDTDEEGQTQLDLDKTKKELKKKIEKAVERSKEAKKAAEGAKAGKAGAQAAKGAKAGAQAAKGAKAGAQAAKVAKTAKSLKTVLNVAKVATLAASAETIGITLLVTVIIWYIQIIGAHILKSKYIPKMSGLDWFGFILLYTVVIIIQIMPFILLLAPIGIGVAVFERIISFLMDYTPEQVMRWISGLTENIM